MAASSSSSNLSKFKPKKPLDVWSTREKLCLASAVYKIGDQNWVSVSRSIKPYAEKNRPSEWFHQKNCVSQYYDMLEQLEQQQPKRKRGDKSENDTPSLQIMRKMTIERSEQLKKEMMEMQHTFMRLQNEVEEINNGQFDDNIEELYEQLRKEELNEEAENVKVKEEVTDDDSKLMDLDTSDMLSAAEIETTQESMDDMSIVDEDSQQNDMKDFPLSTQQSESAKPGSTPSLLLSSLLQSEEKTATGLQQLKREQEQEQVVDPAQSGVKLDDEGSVTSSPAIWSETAGAECTNVGVVEEVLVEETIVEDMEEVFTEEVISSNKCSDKDVETSLIGVSEVPVVNEMQEVPCTIKIETENVEPEKKDSKLDIPKMEQIKVDINKDSLDSDETTKNTDESLALPAIEESTFPEIKDEPMSPTSSVSSRISEPTTSKRVGRGRPKSIRSPRLNSNLTTKKSYADDGGSSRHSDVELSDDDARESDDIVSDNLMASVASTSLLSESFPNSPASLSICSDTEEEKSFKAWKKSILMVWRAAAAHKFASVFSSPVTEEIAPGYHTVIKRPMDLKTIKSNVDNGILRTTAEFQRDMMLMFTNAIMYNSSLHNVNQMAQVMYDDVLKHIEQYVNTQMMMQTNDSKNLRQSRRIDADVKEDDPKKRRLSVEQSEGGKTKKRKQRTEEAAVV